MHLRSALAVTGLSLALALALAVPAHAAPQSWSTPVDVSAADDAETPQVAIAPDGTLTSAWISTAGGASTVMSSTSQDAGATWSAPTAVSATNANVRLPQLVIDSAGTRTLVWADFDGVNTVVNASSSSDGLAWSVPATLSTPGSDAATPAIAVDSAGVRYVAWQQAAATTVISGASSPDGLVWGAVTTFSDPVLNSSHPQVAHLPSGDIVVAWSASTQVQSAVSPDGGATWSPPFDISAVGQPTGQPRLAVSTAGLIAAAWYRVDLGGDQIIQTATSTNGQTWSAPVDLSAAGSSAEMPEIAFAVDGTVHAIWDRFDLGGNTIVQTSHSTDSGATWSAALDLSTATQNGLDAQLAIDSLSNVTVVWTQDDLVTVPIIQSVTSVDGGASFALRSDVSSGGQGAMTARAAVSAADVITVVWSMSDGANTFVQTANSNAAVSAAAPAVLAATASNRDGTAPALLGCGLVAAGVIALALRPRRRGAHRAG